MWCSHLPAGLHREGLWGCRRRVLLLRAAQAKMLLQSLMVLSEKKKKKENEKRASRTNVVFLLIQMIELGCFSVVVFGVCSEML